MVMTCHFLTQLLITLPLLFSELSNCVLFFSHELPILRYTVKICALRIYEKKGSCYVPIRLSKSLKIKLLQIILTAGTLVAC